MISPKEAFEAVKVLWPEVTAIVKPRYTSAATIDLQSTNPKISCLHSLNEVDWGALTQYPPPALKWRPATKEDACRAIMEGGIEARFRDITTGVWIEGYLTGYNNVASCPWRTRSSAWTYCEVRDG